MRLYLISSFALLFFCVASIPVFSQSSPRTDCPEVKVEAEITHTSGGNDNGKIVLKFDNAADAEKYLIILTCAGCSEAKKAEDLAFNNVKAGHYDIYLVDKQGCSKQLSIQLN